MTAELLQSTAPGTSRGGGTLAGPALTSVAVAAAGESAFTVTFELDSAGSLGFVVMYASLMARFVDSYGATRRMPASTSPTHPRNPPSAHPRTHRPRAVSFDNWPGNARQLIGSDLTEFADGAVARGSCAAAGAGVITSCRIGPTAAGGDPDAYSCSPTSSCSVENSCFGALCDYSRYGLTPNTSYKVSSCYNPST